MRRRTFLASLTAGLPLVAGCTGDPSGSPGTRTSAPSSTVDPTGTATAPTEGGGTPNGEPVEVDDPFGAGIVDLGTAPRTYALSPLRYRSDDGADVSMKFAATETADHPATVVASLRNANGFANTFRLDWTPPFGRLSSDVPHPEWEEYGDGTYRVGLVFAPTENHDLVDDPPAIERASDGFWRLAEGGGRWLPETVRLEPGEVVRGEYAVVGKSEGVGKGRPAGVYEFSRGQEGSIRITVWDTGKPGPERESRFAGASVPALPGENEVAWYHEADPTTPSHVRPSAERASLPAKLDFTFVNHARESTSCGHWDLYKLHGGEWYFLGPYAQTADCRVVAPGGSKTWTLAADDGEAIPCDGAATYGHLGGGRYAAVAGYGHATSRSGALVELVGEPATITPTDDASAERDGDTVTVTTPRWDDGDRSPSATLTVTRAGSADETLIPEQVMRDRFRGLRNALAFFEDGVGTVVVRTDEHVAERVVGYESDVRTFAVEGRAYRVEIERDARS